VFSLWGQVKKSNLNNNLLKGSASKWPIAILT
jgi:hypothetical protein